MPEPIWRDVAELIEWLTTEEHVGQEPRVLSMLDRAPRPMRDTLRLVEHGPGRYCPQVAGHCPSCGAKALFLGAGGHVTCASLSCPNPCQVDDELSGTFPRPSIVGAQDGGEQP